MNRDLLPNSTQIPDQLFDHWMPKLSGGEFKVLMYLARRTYGFRKRGDGISLQQIVSGIVKKDGTRLDGGTGLSKETVCAALKRLESLGLVRRQRQQYEDGGNAPSYYEIALPDPAESGNSDPPLCGNSDNPLSEKPHNPLYGNSDIQQTVGQHTVLQQSEVTNVTSSPVAGRRPATRKKPASPTPSEPLPPPVAPNAPSAAPAADPVTTNPALYFDQVCCHKWGESGVISYAAANKALKAVVARYGAERYKAAVAAFVSDPKTPAGAGWQLFHARAGQYICACAAAPPGGSSQGTTAAGRVEASEEEHERRAWEAWLSSGNAPPEERAKYAAMTEEEKADFFRAG